MDYFWKKLENFSDKTTSSLSSTPSTQPPEKKNGLRFRWPPMKQTDKLVELTADNMKANLQKLDVALVLFYFPRDRELSACMKRNLAKASNLTERPKHAFAVVDCERYSGFCAGEGAKKIPAVRMYSKGNEVDFTPKRRGDLYMDMKTWVETFEVKTPAF